MEDGELGPVTELEQWSASQTELVFYLVDGRAEADGAVRLELAMSDGGGQTFVLRAPASQTEPYGVSTDAAALRPWVNRLAQYSKEHAGQIKLAGILNQAVVLSREAPAPARARRSEDEDSDLGDEVSDDSDSEPMEASDDDEAFTTDWDIRMDVRRKAWQAKEEELRREWERERKAALAQSQPSAQPQDYDADLYDDDVPSPASRPSSSRAAPAPTATKEGQQIFAHKSAAFQILSNELIALLKDGPAEGLVVDSVQDSLYTWNVRISNLAQEPLASEMARLKERWGYDYVEFQLDFVPDFPFYPPMLKVVRPRFNGSLVQSLANSDLLKLTYWNPATTVKDVLQQIKGILQKHAKVNHASERNDPAAFPDGAYAQVEDDLIKLALATEIRPRANFAILDVENLEKAPQFRLAVAKEEEEDAGDKRAKKAKAGGWARGTGYGSGLMRSGWDPDSLLKAQAEKERQILRILRSLLAHLRPHKDLSDAEKTEIFSILEASALIPFLEAELMQPSFIEIGQHTEKYSLMLEILGSMEEGGFLLGLLGPLENQAPGQCVMELLSALADTARDYLEAMRRSVAASSAAASAPAAHSHDVPNRTTSYIANIIHKRKSKAQKGGHAAKRREAAGPSVAQSKSEGEEEEEADEDKDDPERRNARLIVSVFRRLSKALAEAGIDWTSAQPDDVTMEDPDSASPSSSAAALEARYKRLIKPLQYGNYTAVCESGAAWAHKFGAKKAKASGVELGPKEMRRIFKEFTALRSSLPLDLASAVAVRVDDGKVHLLRALILGPEGTPYAHGAFLFDVAFPVGYPASPPDVNIITTGNGSVRFNPNLYDNGKVCLSLLGTWSGAKGEQWNPATSTLLQVLVSIQSLIMVEQPYFNEPGYESTLGTADGDNRSKDYNRNIRLGTVKYAMVEQLKHPPPGFEDLLRAHFGLKRERVLAEVAKWEEEDSGNRSLKAAVKSLKEELAKLPDPLAQ